MDIVRSCTEIRTLARRLTAYLMANASYWTWLGFDATIAHSTLADRNDATTICAATTEHSLVAFSASANCRRFGDQIQSFR